MKDLIKKILQLIKFGIVGIINTLVSLAIYYLLIAIGINYIIASVAGYVLSSIAGYFLNKIWVFKAKQVKTAASLVRYYTVYGSSLLLGVGLSYLWVDILNMSDKSAPLFTMCFTIPFNFFLSRLWVFRNRN